MRFGAPWICGGAAALLGVAGAAAAWQAPAEAQPVGVPAPAVTPVEGAPMPAQPVVPMVSPEDRAAERRFSERLRALVPSNPEGYFLLAEEVAEAATGGDAAVRRLAIRLYVLAFELDRGITGRRSVAASACLGLAGVSGTARERQFLQTLARTLDTRHATPGWIDVAEVATSDSGGYRLAVALGDVRSGQGFRARRILEDPTVSGLLTRYDALLPRAGWEHGAFSVQREAERWPCSECRNERVVRKMVQGVVEYQACILCGGVPGVRVTSEQLLRQLRFEAWLLQGKQRSWASQLGVDEGTPLVDPDPSRLGPLFGVDPTLVVWRPNGWIVDPKAPKAEVKKPGAAADKEGGAEQNGPQEAVPEPVPPEPAAPEAGPT